MDSEGTKETTESTDKDVAGAWNKAEDSSDEEKRSTHSSDEENDDEDTSDFSIEQIRKYLSDKLHIGVEEEQRYPHVLKEFTVDGIVEYIKDVKPSKIIVMAGAGISTAAGIPDFRSPGTGLYSNLEKYDLPSPTAIFDIRYFQENPKPFFVLAKELYPGSFRPTLSHYFIKLLQTKGLLLRHYTQNIDTLERVAGVSEEKLVEAHGTFHAAHCLQCSKEYSQEWMKEAIFTDQIPRCESCRGLVKPDIVFFGESLPDRFYECVRSDFAACDLLLIMGTSLVVQPFASLIDRVSDTCPRLLINNEKAGIASDLARLLGGGGLRYDSSGNYRDVYWEGDTDSGCQLLAERLGWAQDLQKLLPSKLANV